MGKLKDIQTHPAFANLSAVELGMLAAACEIKDYNNGEALFKEGEKDASLYIVLKGEIQLVAEQFADDTDPVIVHSDSILGELSVLGERQHRLSAIVNSKAAKLLVISQANFLLLLAQSKNDLQTALLTLIRRSLEEKIQGTLPEAQLA